MQVNYEFTQQCNNILKFGCSPHGDRKAVWPRSQFSKSLQSPKSSQKYLLLMQPIMFLRIQIAGGGCELLDNQALFNNSARSVTSANMHFPK